MRLSFLFPVSLFGTALLACSGSAAGPTPTPTPGTPASATIEYVGYCTPALCAGVVVPQYACASPWESKEICAPSSGGACSISLECKAPPHKGPLCDPALCGPVASAEGIACPGGGGIIEQCVNTGTDCAWQPECPPLPVECPMDSCGPLPALARICGDGAVGTPECVPGTGGACGWIWSCGDDGGAPGQVDGSPGETDGGGGAADGSPGIPGDGGAGSSDSGGSADASPGTGVKGA